MMNKKPLGRTGLYVTPVGFGVLTVGKTQLNYSVSEGAALLRYALDSGFNFLDTAQYYETYPYIREALKGLPFDPVISSKCLGSSYEDMKEAVEEARISLNRDVIDIFLLHEMGGREDFQERQGAWEYLLEAKAKGLVKAVGVSAHDVQAVEIAAGMEELDVVFPLINYRGLGIRNGNGFGTKEQMAEAIRKASDNGKGVFAMKAFGGGNLAVDYKTALDYVRYLPGVDSIMMGFGYRHEIDRIIEYMEDRLDPDYRPDVSKKRMFICQGDCMGCGACMKRCSSKAIFWNQNGLADIDPNLCVTCGYCAPVCPERAIIML